MGEERLRRPGRGEAASAFPLLARGVLLTLGACSSAPRDAPPPTPAVRSAASVPSGDAPAVPPAHEPPAAEAAEVVPPPKPEAPWPGPSTPPAPPPPLGPAASETRGPERVPSWMVSFDATEDQPMGMDPDDVRTFLDRQVRSRWMQERNWPRIWERVFLLMTPAHAVDVPAFALSKYEVTNAQWEVFLRHRRGTYTTRGGETLLSLASGFWLLEPERDAWDVQRGWMNLLATNSPVLMPVLNPTGDPKWDPHIFRAAEVKLPAGLDITYPRYPFPAHWKDGKVPDDERRCPVRGVSWEQCEDFCQWAGFHLPTEAEWERAARGPEGRWFPWGNEWDGTRAVWRGFENLAWDAVVKAQAAGTDPIVRPLDDDSPRPADVDTFPRGATPEGVHHMIGNVSEYVGNRSAPYPGSMTGFLYWGSQLTRGGNFEDRAEVLLAADRNPESHQGALLAQHSVVGYGFRLAAYPVGGADLAAPVAQTWSDRMSPDSRSAWLPMPPGTVGLWRSFGNSPRAIELRTEPLLGFALENAAGILERSLSNDDSDHAFVVGAARGVAFLPVRGFPNRTVRTPEHLAHFARDPDQALLLGVLVGTERLALRVRAPADARTGATRGEEWLVPFRSPDLLHDEPVHRLLTRADLGLMLVLDGDRVAVHRPDRALAGTAAMRPRALGYLADPPQVDLDREGLPSEGRLDCTSAVLAVRIPILREDGSPDPTLPPIRVTIRVPLVAK